MNESKNPLPRRRRRGGKRAAPRSPRECAIAGDHGDSQEQVRYHPDEDHEARRAVLVAHPHRPEPRASWRPRWRQQARASHEQRDAEGRVLGDAVERHGGQDGEARDAAACPFDVAVEQLIRRHESRRPTRSPTPEDHTPPVSNGSSNRSKVRAVVRAPLAKASAAATSARGGLQKAPATPRSPVRSTLQAQREAPKAPCVSRDPRRSSPRWRILRPTRRAGPPPKPGPRPSFARSRLRTTQTAAGARPLPPSRPLPRSPPPTSSFDLWPSIMLARRASESPRYRT